MNNLAHDTPSPLKFTFALGISLILMLTLGLIMIFLYLPSRPRPVNTSIVEERLEKLKKVNQAQAELISTYAWVDDSHTHVRIPIDEAMQLTLKTMNLPPPQPEIPALPAD